MVVVVVMVVALVVVVNIYDGGCFDGCGSGGCDKCLWW